MKNIIQDNFKIEGLAVNQDFQDFDKNSAVFISNKTNLKGIGDIAIWDACATQHCYESNNTPYNLTTANFGSAAQVGVVFPYVENEMAESFKTQLDTDGTYSKIHIPQFATAGVTYYQNSSLNLNWVWLTDGSNYFYKKNNKIYFGSPETSFYKITNCWDGSTHCDNSGSFYDFNIIAEGIVEEMKNNTNITFQVGGAIKIYNSADNTYKIYLCSTHTANITKHQGDFPIFFAWALYQVPVVTDDGKLSRDLESNGADVYHIIS